MDLAVQAETDVYHVPQHVPRICFRAYDIRGPVDSEHITENLAYAIGLAVGTQASIHNQKNIWIGRDGRCSSIDLTRALCAGLQRTGCNVIEIGLVPTPVLYFATHQAFGSGVMVTASHNPAHHNGFKIVLAQHTLSEIGIAGLYERIVCRDYCDAPNGSQHNGLSLSRSMNDAYVHAIKNKIQLDRQLKVVIDASNGAASVIAPLVFEALGCEVIPLFCEIDGRFPNHDPDPSVPENLRALQHRVQAEHADIGLAFDGDGDRLGVVTERGEIVWPDQYMMLFAQDVLQTHPGAEIIYDIKSSRCLKTVVEAFGGQGVVCRSGHSFMKQLLFERNGLLAGEFSGHIFFRDDWFGFDDGIYAGARLLQIVSRISGTITDALAGFPSAMYTPELKMAITEEEKKPFMKALCAIQFSGAESITLDGLRLEFPEGWCLIRPSNTSHHLTVRFEACSDTELRKIQNVLRTAIVSINPHLELPF